MDKFDWFKIACKLTLDLEGKDKYTNNPKDPGGPTKYGISGRYHPGVDIENLTQEGAEHIYYEEYYIPAKCEEQGTVQMAVCLFDSQVNPQNDPKLPGGGNQEILNLHPENWQDYNNLRMARYMRCSSPDFVKGHIFRVLRLSQSIREIK